MVVIGRAPARIDHGAAHDYLASHHLLASRPPGIYDLASALAGPNVATQRFLLAKCEMGLGLGLCDIAPIDLLPPLSCIYASKEE